MGRKVTKTNTLQMGELSGVVTSNPAHKDYHKGLEELDGFDVITGGLEPMKVPDVNSVSGFQYKCYYFNGSYYIGNSTETSEYVDTITPNSSILDTLANRQRNVIAAGNHRAKNQDPAGKPEYNSSGSWLAADQNTVVAKALVDFTDHPTMPTPSAGDIPFRQMIITKTTRIYRGFRSHSDGKGWGVHGKYYKKRRHGTNSPGAWEDFLIQYGIYRGNGGPTSDRHDHYVFPNNYVNEAYHSLTLLYEDLSPGVYQFDADVWVVGNGSMFLNAYKTTIPSYTYDAGSQYLSATAAGFTESLSWATPDVLILFWGSEAAKNSAWNFSTIYKKLSSSGSTSFAFTGRTIVSGSRRFGPAQLSGDASMIGATEIGMMGGSSDNGRVIPSSGTTAASAYVARTDSSVVWCELVKGGILIGTSTAEYLLSNEQVNPLISGGAALTRISGIGSPGTPSDDVSQSAMLFGNVYYISNFGISNLVFSNETNSYVPKHIEFKGRRVEGATATSIAGSADERALYITFSDNTLWKMWPEHGAIGKVPLSLDTLTLVGVRVGKDIVEVIVSDENGAKWVTPAASIPAPTSYLRTTRFGSAPAVRPMVKKLIVGGVGLKKGEYRIKDTLPADDTGWKPLPLTLAEVQNGMTGLKEVWVSDAPGKPNKGKFVEFRINGNTEDAGTLTGVTVEMEV